jgi:hypothetical protein
VKIADLSILLDDFYPAVRGGWVVVPSHYSPSLGIMTKPWEGEIRDIYREETGAHVGRVVLVVYDPASGHDRLTLPERCVSRKPPAAESTKRASAAIDAAEKKAGAALRKQRRKRP